MIFKMAISRYWFLLLPIIFASASAAGEGYARPELLRETTWLAEQTAGPSLRIIDLRPAAAYLEGHIPGAVNIPESELRTADEKLLFLPEQKSLAARFAAAGIGPETAVVAYDEASGRSAARLWYILTLHGHARSALLNGGFSKWKAEGRPVERQVPPPCPSPSPAFMPLLQPALICAAPAVMEREPGLLILDVRSEGEFSGKLLTGGAKRGGHIPGAVNWEWSRAVSGPHQTFRPASELRAALSAAGITPDKRIVPYCATGGRAAHTFFVLHLLGYPNVSLYYGSYADYSARPEAPVEK